MCGGKLLTESKKQCWEEKQVGVFRRASVHARGKHAVRNGGGNGVMVFLMETIRMKGPCAVVHSQKADTQRNL